MRTILALCVLLPALGLAQNVNEDELPEMCAAAYIMAGDVETLRQWKGIFSLRTDIVLEYFRVLQRYEDEDDLPPELLAQAVTQCDRVLSETRSLQSDP